MNMSAKWNGVHFLLQLGWQPMSYETESKSVLSVQDHCSTWDVSFQNLVVSEPSSGFKINRLFNVFLSENRYYDRFFWSFNANESPVAHHEFQTRDLASDYSMNLERRSSILKRIQVLSLFDDVVSPQNLQCCLEILRDIEILQEQSRTMLMDMSNDDITRRYNYGIRLNLQKSIRTYDGYAAILRSVLAKNNISIPVLAE